MNMIAGSPCQHTNDITIQTIDTIFNINSIGTWISQFSICNLCAALTATTVVMNKNEMIFDSDTLWK